MTHGSLEGLNASGLGAPGRRSKLGVSGGKTIDRRSVCPEDSQGFIHLEEGLYSVACTTRKLDLASRNGRERFGGRVFY